MKSLCYLAPTEQEHCFDALFAEHDMVVSYYDITRYKSLVAFVGREKALNQQDIIVFDLTQSVCSGEHILATVQLLRRFSVARLVFIAEAGAETDILFGQLAGFHVSDLVKAGKNTDFQEELRLCMEERPNAFAAKCEAVQHAMATGAGKAVAPVEIPAGLVLTVAVAGTMARIGTTTQSAAIYHYMKTLGFRPAILDRSGAAIATLWELYNEVAQERPGHAVINGITYCTEMMEAYNAYIIDLGILSGDNVRDFESADLAVLCAGTKPWELPYLAQATQVLSAPRITFATLLSFAPPADLATIKTFVGECAAIAPYHPDIWEPSTLAAYAATVLPLVQKACRGSGE